MTTKKEIKVLTELLKLSGVKVISQRQHQGIGIILQIEPTNKESICPHCGTKSHRLHQNRRHIVKDLPWGEQQVFLEINRRQFKCETCDKPFSRRYTADELAVRSRSRSASGLRRPPSVVKI